MGPWWQKGWEALPSWTTRSSMLWHFQYHGQRHVGIDWEWQHGRNYRLHIKPLHFENWQKCQSNRTKKKNNAIKVGYKCDPVIIYMFSRKQMLKFEWKKEKKKKETTWIPCKTMITCPFFYLFCCRWHLFIFQETNVCVHDRQNPR